MASKKELAKETCRALILRIARPAKGERAKLEVLLVQQESKGMESYCLPGGRRESFDASRLECAVREANQETGIVLDYKEPILDIPIVFSKREKVKMGPRSNHATAIYVFVGKEYVFDEGEQDDEDARSSGWVLCRRLPLQTHVGVVLSTRTKYYIHTIFSKKRYRNRIINRGIAGEEIDTIRERIEKSFPNELIIK